MKYINKIVPIIMLTLLLISMLIFADKVIINVNLAVDICINNLLPSMLPFLILSTILSNYGFIEIISKIMHPIMKYLFHLNSNCAYIIILSMLSGSPANSKYITQLLNSKKITVDDANKVLLFSHFVNPIFIIGTVGTVFLNNKLYGYLILVSHYLANIVIGIFTRNKNIPKDKVIISFNNQSKNFITILKSAIKDTIDTLFIVFGTITCCLVVLSIINSYFSFNPILYGILEMTSGLKYISISNISILYKIIISTFFISFGGISIHAQVFSIIDNKKIKYLPYLEARILQGLISSIIAYVIYIVISNIGLI